MNGFQILLDINQITNIKHSLKVSVIHEMIQIFSSRAANDYILIQYTNHNHNHSWMFQVGCNIE